MQNDIEYFRSKLECVIKTKLNSGKNLSPVFYHCGVDKGIWTRCSNKVHPFTVLMEGAKVLNYDDTIVGAVSRKFNIQPRALVDFNRGLSKRPHSGMFREFYDLGVYIREMYYNGER
jgi:hypothetical protein